MLTTTVDGLWVLQAVTGIEQTCPELGLRPLLPRLDTPERALRHPAAAELVAAGALDEAGNVDPMIREWLTVLLRRDLGLLVMIAVPGREPSRASICRFATWWVVLERHDQLVRLYPAGTASSEAAASEIVVGQIERLCGVAEAAPLRPITLDTEQLLASVHDTASLRAFLSSSASTPTSCRRCSPPPTRPARRTPTSSRCRPASGPTSWPASPSAIRRCPSWTPPAAGSVSKAWYPGSAATRSCRPARAATSAERCNG